MVIKWRVQWEIHISLESSFHKEDVKYQTMMWTIMGLGIWAEAHIHLPNEVTWSGMSCFPSPLNFCFNVLHINFFVTYC